MAELTARQMLDYIDQWLKEREGNYSPGDREIKANFKNVKTQLSRIVGIEDDSVSPGARAATNAIAANKRETGPGGTQYSMRETEPRGIENQPKTFEDAKAMFNEAHQKFMDQVGANKNE